MSVRPQPVSYAQHIRAVLDHAAAVERSLPSSLAPELTSLNARTKPSQSPQPPQPESPPPEPLLSIGGIPSVHDSTGLAAPGGPYENAKYANAATWHLYKALRDVHDGRIQVPTEELRGYVQAADNAARTAAQLAPILAELKARALHTPSSLCGPVPAASRARGLVAGEPPLWYINLRSVEVHNWSVTARSAQGAERIKRCGRDACGEVWGRLS